ncbi:hypothetical protein A3A93_00515 [Candidatus Roizmanbacteria bacterium RIFCSPLOWO2_01_FULL_38_12]|uniref:Glycosyltransferase RgtA/B/C/D-like domain-containing protein n=1 Tax=Candidatus Roizmanbacteria bacterium RIFCSPLOWO2_01_FULL_38_12 TaxID=1802061 RepID=A0A1F7IXV0_9BACT|nr:MAG: hypothetical protein A2861_00195 [Candidatus Roizmanbacteria bacterium RIFCSPHIGHO2_01_FULL_38_15]OGK48161.1 MAG: hypothetical protein A3A93_00515 [Candidatus Roizmanbacteria bacterium RIFCSPLOWO2_01_FULL_38_12]
MKYLKFLLNNPRIFLVICVIIAIGLHIYNFGFPCFNSDEASFAYNGYSIAKTGKDEYGAFMPNRFKAFGENKLPVTIYTIVPFVGIFGLNELTSRLPFIIIGALAPLLFYWMSIEFFKNKQIGYIAAFLAAVSPWVQIMSRHIHENIIILLLASGLLIFFAKLQKEFKWKYVILISLINLIGLFTYHIGKTISIYSFIVLLFILLKSKGLKRNSITKSILIFLVPVFFFLWTEISQPTNRVGNLLFTSNTGFTLKIEELRREHDIRLLHNKLTESVLVLTNKYLTYFSPEFLVIHGDTNDRFGFDGISPITPIEYILFFIGLYFLFKNNEKVRFLITSFLLMAPISAALSWQDYSITRSYLMIIPILLLSAYGGYNFIQEINGKLFRLSLIMIIVMFYVFFQYFSWDYYFFHYPKKPDVISAWQCGYKELGKYVQQTYDKTDKYYITKKLGQPYIFMLFYLKYPPADYQKQASLSAPDEYGFGQVEKFDKFTFSLQNNDENKLSLYITTSKEDELGGSRKKLETVNYNEHEIFNIYE